jgi:N,N'-diacetyllegionaminate synthase
MRAIKTFIIAEAGVNHNGNIAIAKKMIDAAASAGADAVKFQTFQAEKITIRQAPKANYQIETTGAKETQFEMLKKLELDEVSHRLLMDYCVKRRIIFLSTPFDIESIEMLVELGLNTFKIPSGEITNLPYLGKIGSLKKKIILSTGMADMKEVEEALALLTSAGTPKKNITILHCNTEYPTPFNDANLLAMTTMKRIFGLKVGYSDHTPGIEASIAAVALGAEVIEKHFTLDRSMEGPDHRASLEPDELRMMIMAIRNVEKALGNGDKKPSPSERKNKVIARKSIVASRSIKKGDLFTAGNITVKRPGTGISPMKWDSVIGRKAPRDFKADEMIAL